MVFLQGCPFRCPYCHNAGILDPRAKGEAAWESVLETLRSRQGLLDGVVFSGGEALMQASSGALGAALEEVRSLGFQTGLHAGGAYPAALSRLLDAGLLDWVGLDLKALPQDYLLATGRPGGDKAAQSVAVLAAHPEVAHEVRLTLWPGLAPRGDLVDYAAQVAWWARSLGARHFALQRYRQPPGVPDALPEVGWDDEDAYARLEPLGFETLTVR